jgi:hypothetical protein
LGELPDAEIADQHVTSLTQHTQLTLKNIIVAKVVTDRGNDRNIVCDRHNPERLLIRISSYRQIVGEVASCSRTTAVTHEEKP